MKRTVMTATALLLCAGLAAAGTRADLSGDAVVDFTTTMDMPLMAVGNSGNAADTRYDTPGYGAVDYAFRMGKFEVTAGQYTDFLNAVAATDTYGLYNTHMADPSVSWGCNIQRTGSSGSYVYSVAADWADRPVNFVSWGDTARFCNWLTNGMPTGAQDLTTTEDGSYFINGETSHAAMLALTRIADGNRISGKNYYFIPTEDEWYKAAYHKNDGVTSNYFDYPTSSDGTPSNVLIDPDPGNNANFLHIGNYTIDSPYYRTEVGEFENSESPYGTFDQGGNVLEWNEAIPWEVTRGIGGGSFGGSRGHLALLASGLSDVAPTVEYTSIGFRVSEVPEPATLSLLALGGLALLRRRHN